MRGASKQFGAVRALEGVSLELRGGSILGLCGENGAGKSTLVKLLTGVLQPDSGEVVNDGQPCRLASPRDAQALGIALVSQELAVCPELTVLDNIWLGHAATPFFHRRGGLRQRAQQALDRVGCRAALDARVATLSLGERQLVEIARMLTRDARVLILDEPTATLTDVEIDAIFAALQALRQEGRALVLVTHRLAEVFRICDRVAVMRNGQLVADLPAAETDRDGLIHLMLGRELGQAYPREAATPGPERLRAAGLRQSGLFGPLDLGLRAGTITCLVGQLGAGAAEVVRALAGLAPDAQGDVRLNGEPLALGRPQVALARGLMFVSGDRAAEGIFQQLSVQDNLTATRLRDFTRGGVLRRRALARTAAALAQGAGVDAGRLRSRAGELSGGNQQKLAFGRCLERGQTGVLAMIEPTRGIDIGARADIYRLMRAFCAQGHALLVASSDLEEVMGIADEIVTLYRGQVVGRYGAAQATMHQVVADITHPRTEEALA